MISYIIYGIYNLIYQLFIMCFLFYANTYLNAAFFPDSWIWKDGKLREDTGWLVIPQSLILIIEAALLIFLIYYMNKWYLLSIAKSNNSHSIAAWTKGAYSVITLAFLIYFIYAVSK